MGDLSTRRRDYTGDELHKTDLATDPFDQFRAWLDGALQTEGIIDPTAMTLATASPSGRPSARIVLLKGIEAGGFVFFTNYDSRKGSDMAANPQACLLAYWERLHRQVRIEGSIQRVSEEESTAYFQSRPRESQIGALASTQSKIIPNRATLDNTFARVQAEAGDKVPIERPPNWGGYRLTPDLIEFWQGRPSRLHDRLQYSLQPDGSWHIDRLSP